MKKLITFVLLSVSALLASSIEIKDAYVRATPPGLENSAAFMTIENTTSKDIAIVKITSLSAKAVELHTHDMTNGIMRMYQVPRIVVSQNSEIVLQPSGYHVMFIGLFNPLKIGETVTFTLELSNGETKTVIAPIKSVMGGMMNDHMNHNH
mgnify:CR=1 FL=1|tara:strand:+ start:59 stop:511 length:453 start_codon:yes stop_codon:yes gene_type:complete